MVVMGEGLMMDGWQVMDGWWINIWGDKKIFGGDNLFVVMVMIPDDDRYWGMIMVIGWWAMMNGKWMGDGWLIDDRYVKGDGGWGVMMDYGVDWWWVIDEGIVMADAE